MAGRQKMQGRPGPAPGQRENREKTELTAGQRKSRQRSEPELAATLCRTERKRASGILSGRLQMLADMVTQGNRLADVGCDHGYLCIDLVGSGICPTAIAMDVREGPLAAANIHIREAGLEDRISTRLSDGLAGCRAGEADTLVCAGMGGRLMERIIRADLEKAKSMRELILQPQSELQQFRAFLRENGFQIIEEDAVREDGKYYFAMKAVQQRSGTSEKNGSLADPEVKGLSDGGSGRRTGEGGGTAQTDVCGQGMEAAEVEERQRLYDRYGEILLRKKHPVLWQYLQQRESYVRRLESSLAAADTPRALKRRQEVCRELEELGKAMACYQEAETEERKGGEQRRK